MSMEKQGFNPHNPEYKKVEDLPQDEQNNFENVEGGFVRKEAAEVVRTQKDNAKYWGDTAEEYLMDMAHEEDYERLPEMLKEFNAEHMSIISGLRKSILEGIKWNPFKGELQDGGKNTKVWGSQLLHTFLRPYMVYENKVRRRDVEEIKNELLENLKKLSDEKATDFENKPVAWDNLIKLVEKYKTVESMIQEKDKDGLNELCDEYSHSFTDAIEAAEALANMGEKKQILKIIDDLRPRYEYLHKIVTTYSRGDSSFWKMKEEFKTMHKKISRLEKAIENK